MEFKAKAGITERFLTVFTDVLLVVAIVIWFMYKLDILIVILLLAVSGFGCSWYITHQPIYKFKENGFEIVENPPFKSSFIPFDCIIDFRVIGNFSSINAKNLGKVLITYSDTQKGKYRNQICTPADIYGFVDVLRKGTEKAASKSNDETEAC